MMLILGPLTAPMISAVISYLASSAGALTTLSPSTTSSAGNVTDEPASPASLSTVSTSSTATFSCLPPQRTIAYTAEPLPYARLRRVSAAISDRRSRNRRREAAASESPRDRLRRGVAPASVVLGRKNTGARWTRRLPRLPDTSAGKRTDHRRHPEPAVIRFPGTRGARAQKPDHSGTPSHRQSSAAASARA